MLRCGFGYVIPIIYQNTPRTRPGAKIRPLTPMNRSSMGLGAGVKETPIYLPLLSGSMGGLLHFITHVTPVFCHLSFL